MVTIRRECLKAAAALLAAAAAQQGRFAYAGEADLQRIADALLRQAAEAGDVPSEIAIATTPRQHDLRRGIRQPRARPGRTDDDGYRALPRISKRTGIDRGGFNICLEIESTIWY